MFFKNYLSFISRMKLKKDEIKKSDEYMFKK